MNPLLIDVPMELKTERLMLRAPFQKGDGPVVNQAIRDSFKDLKEWLPFAQELPAVEDTEINLRSAHIKFLNRESFRFLIFHQEHQTFIGAVSLQGIDWDIPKCEIGYWINTKFSGNGYMKEAVERVVHLGLHQLKLKRIEIKCESDNHKSKALAEAAGFVLEGVLRNEDYSADGTRLTDTCYYSVIN